MYVVNVDYSIYLRSQPNESSNDNIICEIPLGASVGFIERTNGKYYKIRLNGQVGYATAEYLR